jgi:uncharacterized membrane protein
MEIIIISLLSLLVIPVVAFTEGVIRSIIGIAFALLFPGYVTVSAVFPRKTDKDGIERLALSLGLSVAIVPFLVLVHNFLPWGISLYPVLFTVVGFIVIVSAVALYRRMSLPVEARFTPNIRFGFTGTSRWWASQRRWDRVLVVLIIAVLVLSAGGFVGVVVSSAVGEKLTEFYLLDQYGRAESYPTKLVIGEKAEVIAVIVDRERAVVQYELDVFIGDERIAGPISFSLGHGEKWEERVSISPSKPGPKQRVEFQLFKGASTDVYRAARLFIDVAEK